MGSTPTGNHIQDVIEFEENLKLVARGVPVYDGGRLSHERPDSIEGRALDEPSRWWKRPVSHHPRVSGRSFLPGTRPTWWALSKVP